ncbi:MAG: dehydrogenase [Rhizobiales bacterium 32-66-8]|nr:MAG: dehydrogenase [Rhizobiales bacterium 32-66-8]
MARIAVLGHGVAALAAARRLVLAGAAPLLIAPPGDMPQRGETLSPRALPSLEKLGWSGLLDPAVALPGAGRFSIWGDDTLRRDPETGQDTGFHIDRPRLQTRMAQTLQVAGVARLWASAVTLAHQPTGVRIDLSDGGVVEVAAVIDATGRAALSCGPAAERRRLDRLVAVYGVCDLDPDDAVASATLVEAVAHGWWYMAPLPGRRMMLGLFTDTDLVPEGIQRDGAAFVACAAQTFAIAPRLESLGLGPAFGSAAPEVVPATSALATRVWEGRILRAGDAAASLDPLGANGLATAIWSGIKAAEAALGLEQGDAALARSYEQEFLAGIVNFLATQRALYSAERRFASSPFWVRRHSLP